MTQQQLGIFFLILSAIMLIISRDIRLFCLGILRGSVNILPQHKNGCKRKIGGLTLDTYDGQGKLKRYST